jgi:RNA polymerase sigma factor (sigma-70 family)
VGRVRSRDEEDVADEVLLTGMAVGDDRSSLLFVRRYQRRLFGLAVGIVGDSALAEDVAQESFIRIFRHASVFDPRRGSVATWTLTITRNLAIDALRLRSGTPTNPDDQLFLDVMSTGRLPEDAAIAEDALDFVRVALKSLPIEQRRAVLLAAMYGRTAQEIATSEEIPVGTAKSRIRLAMEKLRGSMVTEEEP